MPTADPALRSGATRAQAVLPAPRRSPEPPADTSIDAPADLSTAAVDLDGVTPRRPRRSPRPGSGPVVVALTCALVVALGLACYLWVSVDAWRDRAEGGDAERARLAASATALQQRVTALQGDLDASDARVEQLAAERARAADLAAATAQRSGSSARSAAASAAGLTRSTACAASLRALLDVVLAGSAPDATAVRRLAVSADEDCARVDGVGDGSALADALP